MLLDRSEQYRLLPLGGDDLPVGPWLLVLLVLWVVFWIVRAPRERIIMDVTERSLFSSGT